MEIRIGLAQTAPRLGDVEANLEMCAARLRELADQGAHLAVFPELALTGYLLQDLVPDVAMAAADPRLAALSRDAPETTVAIGFVEESTDHVFYNSAALLRGGELIGLHRKVYLPTYGLFDEGRFTSSGDRIRAIDAGEPIGPVGLSVCEDFWHPTLPILQALDGAELLVNLASGPARSPGSAGGITAAESWHRMHETYALLAVSALAFCNRVGNEEGLTFWGGSRLLAADGTVVVQAPLYEECVVIGALETDDVRMRRYNLPLLADERIDLTVRELGRITARRGDLFPFERGAAARAVTSEDHHDA